MSQVPYPGLTLAEYQANPRQNPFVHDEFAASRWSVAAQHGWRYGAQGELRTAVYYTYFDRDWWRQSSNSSRRSNDASDVSCGGMQNLSTTCGNEGRLRQHYTAGIDQRVAWRNSIGDARLDSEVGGRWHIEKQMRVQVNGDTPQARSAGSGVNAGLREQNQRRVSAGSAFWQSSLQIAALGLHLGLRYESIHYERRNLISGALGTTQLDTWIPGLGVTYSPREGLSFFAGAHRGFAPPRVEDILTANGGSVDLQPEQSNNYELGGRLRLSPHSDLSVTLFRMDFRNQIIPASVAGGAGAALTSAGATRHQGSEFAMGHTQPLGASKWRLSSRLAATWLPDARFQRVRFSSISGFGNIDVSGNRLPYAADVLGYIAMALESDSGLRLQLDGHYTGSSYTDDLNTGPLQANGQRGRVGGAAVWNLTAEYRATTALSVFATVKNATGKEYIVDLSRGIVPGHGRLGHLGIEYRF